LGNKKVIQVSRRLLKSREAYFALITTHAKLRINFRRLSKAFIKPMQCLARWALNVHLTKAMNTQGRVKGPACKRRKLWNWWWSKR
jgi:hypothetical protein